MARGKDTGSDPARQVSKNALNANYHIKVFKAMGYDTVHDSGDEVYMRPGPNMRVKVGPDMSGFYAQRSSGKTFNFNATQPHNLDAKLAGPDYKGSPQHFWDKSQGPEGGDVWSQRFKTPGQGPSYGPAY